LLSFPYFLGRLQKSEKFFEWSANWEKACGERNNSREEGKICCFGPAAAVGVAATAYFRVDSPVKWEEEEEKEERRSERSFLIHSRRRRQRERESEREERGEAETRLLPQESQLFSSLRLSLLWRLSPSSLSLFFHTRLLPGERLESELLQSFLVGVNIEKFLEKALYAQRREKT